MKTKFFALFLLAMATNLSVYSQISGVCGENITWNITNGVLSISGTGSMSDYESYGNTPPDSWGIITSVIINEGVTRIGNCAFIRCYNLTSVTIPNSVTSIGNHAFFACSSLDSIEISDGVIDIGNQAFASCNNLTSVTIGNNVTTIHGSYFQGCNLTSIIVKPNNIKFDSRNNCNAIIESASNTLVVGCQNTIIPQGVEKIGQYAFCGTNESLTSINIPNSVTSIGYAAFNGSALKSVTIPSSVIDMGTWAFANCNRLTSITCEALNPPTLLGNQVFENINKSIPLYVPAESVVLYNTAEQWNEFLNILPIGTPMTEPCVTDSGICGIQDDNLTWLLDCNGVLHISGIGAMEEYSYSVPASWNSNSMFISSVIVDDGVTTIGEYSFNSCVNLTSVTIPSSVTSIGKYAFQNCDGLISITLPNNVTSIGDYAFYGCNKLTSAIIGNGTTSIGKKVFDGCANLSAIDVDSNNLTYTSADGVLYNKNKTTIIQYPKAKQGAYVIPEGVSCIKEYTFAYCNQLTSVEIPSNVTIIEQYAFEHCSSLESITIGSGVTSIGMHAFFNCSNLLSFTVSNDNHFFSSLEGVLFNKNKTTLIRYPANKQGQYIIPNNVTKIEEFAFTSCYNLNTIKIPKNVTSIGRQAFFDCRVLASIYSGAVAPPILEQNVFERVDKSIPLYVPAESINLYRTANGWQDFTNIQAIPETEEVNCNIHYIDKNSALLSSEHLTFHVPEAPAFEGFTFVGWDVVGGHLEDGIVIQAVYEAEEPTSAPEVYTNPENPAQKLIREGNVYILKGEKVYTITGQLTK